MTPGFHIVGSLIPAFFKNSMQLELQIICQLWLTLFVESLLINFGEGDIKIVGYNIYKAPVELPPICVFQHPEGVEERQKAKLVRLREKRDNEKVNITLNALEDACKRDKNVMRYTIECAKACCSEGEIFKIFKKAFGMWRPPVFW